jgi:hypothetical protein
VLQRAGHTDRIGKKETETAFWWRNCMESGNVQDLEEEEHLQTECEDMI